VQILIPLVFGAILVAFSRILSEAHRKSTKLRPKSPKNRKSPENASTKTLLSGPTPLGAFRQLLCVAASQLLAAEKMPQRRSCVHRETTTVRIVGELPLAEALSVRGK